MAAYRHTLTRQVTPATMALGLPDTPRTHDGLSSLVRLLARQAARSTFAASSAFSKKEN